MQLMEAMHLLCMHSLRRTHWSCCTPVTLLLVTTDSPLGMIHLQTELGLRRG